jgi:hypothetical protein
MALATSLTMSCKTTVLSPDNHQGMRLILANGGGFTGQVVEYILLDNGVVFRKNSMDRSVSRIKKLDRKETDQVFRNYFLLRLDESRLDEPGNMYFYIELSDKDQTANRLQWNTESTGTDVEQAKLFYRTTLNKIKE